MKQNNGFKTTKRGYVTNSRGLYVKKESPNHFIVYLDIYPLIFFPRVTFELCNGVLEYKGVQDITKSLAYNSLIYTFLLGVLIYYTSPIGLDKAAVVILLCLMIFIMFLTFMTISVVKTYVRKNLSLEKLQSMNLLQDESGKGD